MAERSETKRAKQSFALKKNLKLPSFSQFPAIFGQKKIRLY